MATEKSLYAQFIKLCRKDLQFFAADKNKTEAKFKFQGQSARSQLCFDLDLDWIDKKFRTREPDFSKKIYQSHDDKQDDIRFNNFHVPIGNAKCVKSFKFQNDASTLEHEGADEAVPVDI